MWNTLLLIALIFSTTGLSRVDSRLIRDQQFKQEFLKLHFFHKGRGMHISPDLIEFVEIAKKYSRSSGKDFGPLKHRYGITQNHVDPVGLFSIDYEGMKVGVLGCVACHSGKAAGQFIIGIGNKNIDVGRIGGDAFLGQKFWKTITPETRKSEAYKLVENSAISFTKELKDPKRGNLTQGLVPTSVIRKWFYRMANEPYPEDMPRGAVKVPHLFGYSEKRKVGQFADAGGNGLLPGWGIAVELAAGQIPENVREYAHLLEPMEASLGDLLPPQYPFAIDSIRANRGKVVFENTCAKCHGTYDRDSENLPIYMPPKVIPWKGVKTDHDRLENLDEHFLGLIRTSPLSDLIQQTSTQDSYVAPRLHAIWARFPYLHNGSVPSISDLLKPASERTRFFSLRDAGERERFDEDSLGLKVKGRHEVRGKPTLHSREIYDTGLQGQSNQGHEFQTGLDASAKQDLIEYLKTL
jgi:mono/diheme cytochrome c family protein